MAAGSLLACAAPASAAAAPTQGQRGVLSEPLPVSKQEVALTFDDGPSPGATPQILALLKSHGAHATFFVLGSELERFPGLGAQEARTGNEVADHGMTHKSLPGLSQARMLYELRATADLIQELTGKPPAFARPPYGNMSQRVLQVARSLHMSVALWSTDTLDWQTPGAATIARRALQGLAPGQIVLMHDGGGPRQQTVQAVREILDALDARGYKAVTLAQLVQDAKPSVAHHMPHRSSPPRPVS
jgi:peptidoglycan/xylan/chitin deacetylase (PgdA/CDA1 family)